MRCVRSRTHFLLLDFEAKHLDGHFHHPFQTEVIGPKLRVAAGFREFRSQDVHLEGELVVHALRRGKRGWDCRVFQPGFDRSHRQEQLAAKRRGARMGGNSGGDLADELGEAGVVIR